MVRTMSKGGVVSVVVMVPGTVRGVPPSGVKVAVQVVVRVMVTAVAVCW